MTDADTIRASVAAVRERVRAAERAAGRPEGSVVLVGASKTRSADEVAVALGAGVTHFGENYAQELDAKAPALPDATWHFIGHLQRNKARVVARHAARMHTVDSARLADAVDAECGKLGRRLPVLLEINVAGEASKSGVSPDDAPALLAHVRGCPHLLVDGLMTLPPDDDTPERWFTALRELRDRLAAESGTPLPHLSMGMSHDLEAAVAAGATFVRVGTALFGPRPPRPTGG